MRTTATAVWRVNSEEVRTTVRDKLVSYILVECSEEEAWGQWQEVQCLVVRTAVIGPAQWAQWQLQLLHQQQWEQWILRNEQICTIMNHAKGIKEDAQPAPVKQEEESEAYWRGEVPPLVLVLFLLFSLFFLAQLCWCSWWCSQWGPPPACQSCQVQIVGLSWLILICNCKFQEPDDMPCKKEEGWW